MNIPRLPSLVAALLLAVPSPATAQDPAPQDLIVRAKTIVLAPDAVLANGSLLLRGGKVALVGDDIPAEARERTAVVDYGDAVLVPGFVLPLSTLGREGDLAETALPFTPDLRAVEAFDPWQEELGKLPGFGITALGLTPAPRNVAAGIGALVKPGRTGGTVAAPETHVVFSLSSAARNPERPPTSLMGAVDLLRSAFAAARAGTQVGPDVAVARQVLQGSRRAVIFADSFAELQAALDLARDFAFEPVLAGASDAERVWPRLVQQRATLALPPLRADSRLAQLALPARLAEAGLPFCFLGRPEQARLSAVLAVRHGLDRKSALQALTRTPAALLGQQELVGTLRQGHAADFAVWSGDPLDLASAWIATWIDGARVAGAAGTTAGPRRRTPAAASPTTAAAAGER